MTACLIDTHARVWLATDPGRIPSEVRSTIEAATTVHVSAASAHEIAQKVRLGRMPLAAGLLARRGELLDALMAVELPLTAREMIHAGRVEWQHRDPFDRMLVAQAQLGGVELVTKDARIREFSEVSCIDGA